MIEHGNCATGLVPPKSARPSDNRFDVCDTGDGGLAESSEAECTTQEGLGQTEAAFSLPIARKRFQRTGLLELRG